MCMVLEENKAARAAPSVLPGENGARGSGGTGELGRARPEPVPGEGLPLFWAAASPPPPSERHPATNCSVVLPASG